jgi:hypothetical protein
MRMTTCRFLTNAEIEASANDLLAGYAARFGARQHATTPLEEIVESHLSISLGFSNLQEDFQTTETILGATFLQSNEIVISDELDPYEHPLREGRYRFTLAHEIGHWVLHRPQAMATHQASLILCRSTSRPDRLEWQANQFAAYLLMPAALVKIGWENMYGSSRPMVVIDELLRASKTSLHEGRGTVLPLVKDLARIFHVSSHAMQIRLEGMGLIVGQAIATPAIA